MKKTLKNISFAAMSALVGFASGLLGGGGGMLLVPLLEKMRGLDVKKSHATAVAIVLPTSLAGAVTYILNGFFEPVMLLGVSGGCVAGGLVGAYLLGKLPASATAVIFALIMLAVGVKLTFF